MKRIKKVLLLIIVFCVGMASQPNIKALAYNVNMHGYVDAWSSEINRSNKYSKNYDGFTSYSNDLSANATHSEKILHSYYAVVGNYSTTVNYHTPQWNTDLEKDFVWSDTVSIITLHATTVGSVSGTIKFESKSNAISVSGRLTSASLSMPITLKANEKADVSADMTAIGFRSCVLSLTGIVTLNGPDGKIYSDYDIFAERDLRKLLD